MKKMSTISPSPSSDSLDDITGREPISTHGHPAQHRRRIQRTPGRHTRSLGDFTANLQFTLDENKELLLENEWLAKEIETLTASSSAEKAMLEEKITSLVQKLEAYQEFDSQFPITNVLYAGGGKSSKTTKRRKRESAVEMEISSKLDELIALFRRGPEDISSVGPPTAMDKINFLFDIAKETTEQYFTYMALFMKYTSMRAGFPSMEVSELYEMALNKQIPRNAWPKFLTEALTTSKPAQESSSSFLSPILQALSSPSKTTTELALFPTKNQKTEEKETFHTDGKKRWTMREPLSVLLSSSNSSSSSSSHPRPTPSSLSPPPPTSPATISTKNANTELLSTDDTSPPSSSSSLPIPLSSSPAPSTSLPLQNSLERTPLHSAAESGNLQLIKHLLKETSLLKMEARSINGNTPLHLAAYFGHTEVVRTLVKTDQAKLDSKNSFGETPLHLAASCGSTETLVALVQMGAKKEEKDGSGGTALHTAARLGDCEAVRMLLYLGADRRAKNHKGFTPLQVAERKGHEEVAEVLESVGEMEEPKKSIFW